ncbi:rod shape-determining protein MreC [Spirochaetales bacterium BR193]|uniref:Cell shape-determining protein MreC n=2 Tax=Entomospira entomophila TaxID=2719988 RepID=A0A968G9Y5_9SPIO|nr:rod shape-determining protein MreC [Entomospira entomophilus]
MMLYITLSIFMIMSRESGISQRITTSGVRVLSGVQTAIRWSFNLTEDGIRNLTEFWSIRKHYMKLQHKLEDYAEYELQAHRLTQENQRLRALLELPPMPGFQQMTAQIITWDPSNLQHGFMIGKGAHAGVVAKMLVLAYNSDRQVFGVIGRIAEVFPHSARVIPLSHPDSFLTVRIEPSGFEGLVNGGSWSGDRLLLRYISRNALPVLSIGDMAVTTTLRKYEGEAEMLIGDLYVGEVESIIDNPTLDSLEISLKSIVDIGRVEHVVVLKPNETSQLQSELDSVEQTRVYQDFYQTQEQAGLPARVLGES